MELERYIRRESIKCDSIISESCNLSALISHASHPGTASPHVRQHSHTHQQSVADVEQIDLHVAADVQHLQIEYRPHAAGLQFAQLIIGQIQVRQIGQAVECVVGHLGQHVSGQICAGIALKSHIGLN